MKIDDMLLTNPYEISGILHLSKQWLYYSFWYTALLLNNNFKETNICFVYDKC